jgi:WD40 repeat protein
VVTAGQDGAARVWDAGTGRALSPWLPHRGPVTHASFAPDGVRVVTASADGTARVWELLAPDDRPLKELALVAEVLAGQRPGANRAGAPSTPATYLKAWQQLNAARPSEYAGR